MGEKIEGVSETDIVLKPDISTLRHNCFSESGAFVLADCVDLPFAPRSVLKNAILTHAEIDPRSTMSMSFGLEKFKPDENQVPTRKSDG